MSSLIEQFEKDDVYAAYLSTSFDPKTHASFLVQGAVVTEHLAKLSIGINKLEKEIETQVGSHYEDLLAHASGLGTLEEVLDAMDERIQTLRSGVERLRTRVVEPYTVIERQTLILGRLQSTCELLRRVLRCLSLSQRLHEQMLNPTKDITKAATSLRELDDLGSDVDLTGISILEKDQRFIRQARSDVEKQATLMMDRGMASQNQTQVGTALQVFYNLGMLRSSVDKMAEGLVKELRKSAVSALDVNILNQSVQEHRKSTGPGGASMNLTGKSIQFRANLWTALEKLMENIHIVCLKASHLYKVLSKKRDSVTHVCFLTEVFGKTKVDLFTSVWTNVITILTEEFSKSVSGSNYIRQALEVDYPKLLRLFGDVCKKLESIGHEVTNIRSNNQLNDVAKDDVAAFDPESALRSSIVALEKAYISRSLSRLFDAVNIMFSSNMVPSNDEIDSLIKTIINELNVSSFDTSLSGTIARNVVKTLQLFCQKCEQLLVTGGDASQVIGPPTPGQQLNVNIVNQLMYLSNQVERTTSGTLAHLPVVVTETLSSSIPMISNQMSISVEPLFKSLNESIEAILLTMHKEDFSKKQSKNGCSLYMKELQSFISRAATDYLSPFHQSPIIREKINHLASSCLNLFIRHISLIRPLGEDGKMRLSTDFTQMEHALNPLTKRLSDLGKSYKVFRSFKPLLFETPSAITETPSLGDVLPFSIVLHFLFSKAPSIKSPHETAGWSESRYSAWLDDHPGEKERLQLIQGSLEAYATGIRSRNQTQYDSVYPFMVQLLEKGLEYWANKSI